MIVQSVSWLQTPSLGEESTSTGCLAVAQEQRARKMNVSSLLVMRISVATAERRAVQRRAPKATVRCNGRFDGGQRAEATSLHDLSASGFP